MEKCPKCGKKIIKETRISKALRYCENGRCLFAQVKKLQCSNLGESDWINLYPEKKKDSEDTKKKMKYMIALESSEIFEFKRKEDRTKLIYALPKGTRWSTSEVEA